VWRAERSSWARQSRSASDWGEIRSTIVELCRLHVPSALALEKAFVAQNVQSAFRLGEARGAVLIAAADAGVAVFEYAPAR
jgi:crossover junction endodeoxyribonuclease RuvC